MEPLRAIIRVRTYELDSFGHVNNSVYLNYFEEARAQYLEQLGLSFHDFARIGVHLVIVESFVRYLSPARFGEEIVVAGRFRDVRGARLTIDYGLTELSEGRQIAEGWTSGAFVEPETGRPRRAPEPFASAFQRAAAMPPAAG